MGRLAIALQGIGGLAVAVGLFLAFSPGVALAVVGVLAVASGTVLEVAHHPRVLPAPRPPTRDEQRAHSLADRAAHASER